MRLTRRLVVLSAAAMTAASLTAVAQAAPVPRAAVETGRSAVPTSWPAVPVADRLQPWLAEQLAAGGTAPLRVMVSGQTTAAAEEAVAAAGLRAQQVWAQVGIVVAVGSPAQVRAVVPQPGVTQVEGEAPLAYHLDTAHAATRSDQALTTYTTPDGKRVDGAGVTIAVIDSGIDGTHPMFNRDGRSKVVRNLENVCAQVNGPTDACFQQEPTNDTDTNSAGGHGTHVAGIAAGYEVEVPAGDPAAATRTVRLRGAAPEAKLVGLSVGAAISLINANAAMNWVVEHQAQPCKAATQQSGPPDAACPPIRATNHSYGPVNATGEDNTFAEGSATVRIQRALVAKGVTPVWAAGNDGGDGSVALTNPPGMDPTPGVLMVASYDDGQNGARDNQLSGFSSRGKRGVTGSYPDLSAPGDLITSACRRTLTVCQGSPSYDGGNYQTISGTSMATPYVAGVVAQLVQDEPTISPGRVEDLLEDTAHEFAAGGAYEADPLNLDSATSFDKGHGLVDVLAVLAAAQGLPAPAEPPAVSVPVACGGTDLVKDATGDARAPVSGAPAGTSQDVTSVSFEAATSTVTVSLDVVGYDRVPAPGTASTIYEVSWTGPKGIRYGVTYQSAGGSFEAGELEADYTFKDGTSTVVPGTERTGPDGGLTWSVPRSRIGNPVIPVVDPVLAAVQAPVAKTYGSVGTGASGGLVFVAPMDRGPDGGTGPSWSVCATSGGSPTTGGDVTGTPSPMPEPSDTTSAPTDPTVPVDPPTTEPPTSPSTAPVTGAGQPEGSPTPTSGGGGPSGSAPSGGGDGTPPSPTDPPAATSTATPGPTGTSSGAAASTDGQVVALDDPVRVMDSRNGTGTVQGLKRDDVVLDLSGRLPAGATAAVLNVTVTNPTAAGFVVAFPAGTSRPTTSNVNFRRGQTQANEVLVRVSDAGRVVLHVDSASAHLVADLVGYVTPAPTAGAGRLAALASPVRVVDTRERTTRRVRGELPVEVASRVPAGATAVLLNVTLTAPEGRGFAVVHPTGRTRPGTSNVNVEGGQTQANEVLSRIGRDGQVSVFVDSTAASVVVDLVGYLVPAGAEAGSFVALPAPVRAADTRTGTGAAPRTGDTVLRMPSAVPAEATAVVLNVTAVGGSRPGFVTVFPTGSTRPGTSNVNFATGTVQANEVLTRLGADRSVTLHVGGSRTPTSHLVVDVVGYTVPSDGR